MFGFCHRRMIRQTLKEMKEMAKKVQQSIDGLKADFAELRGEVVKALDELDARVAQAPEAADDADELEAIRTDVQQSTQAIRDAMSKPAFEPSGN